MRLYVTALKVLAWVAVCSSIVRSMHAVTEHSVDAIKATRQSLNTDQLLTENLALKEKIQLLTREVEFMKHQVKYRCPQFTGPFPRDWAKQGDCIPQDLMWGFTMEGAIPFGFGEPEKEASKKLMETRKAHEQDLKFGQERIVEFWPEDKCRSFPDTQLGGGLDGCLMLKRMAVSNAPFWTKALIDHFVDRVKKGDDISPEDYWHSATDVKKAADVAGLSGMDVLVAGSISPWVESVLLASGVDTVSSVDYNPPRSNHSSIKTLSMDEVLKPSSTKAFDSIFSYSSLEHDGLGRYGDPFNPVGDFAAVRELNRLLKPGGLLLLGVPTQPEDDLPFNSGRIYGPLRLPKLIENSGLVFEGFVFNGTHVPGPLPLDNMTSPFWKHNRWSEHAIMLLRKTPNDKDAAADGTASTPSLADVTAQVLADGEEIDDE